MEALRGFIHIYCGDGKGKTTAAQGLALRAAGSGMKVLIAQFFKTGASSEIRLLAGCENITVYSEKKHFGRYSNMTDMQRREAAIYYRQYFDEVAAMSENADMLVLDEVISAAGYGIIELERLIGFLNDSRRAGREIVLTGRSPDKKLIELADYVTEMKKLKHPYDKGTEARKGIEY